MKKPTYIQRIAPLLLLTLVGSFCITQQLLGGFEVEAQGREQQAGVTAENQTLSPSPTISPVYARTDDVEIEVPKVEEIKTAKVTAYSCGGLVTDKDIDMNCPSLRKYPEGRTANGTVPVPYKTAACDPANMGREFEIEGVGVVKCTDTGGAIKGAGRFDLYVTDVHEARQWGIQYIEYEEVL